MERIRRDRDGSRPRRPDPIGSAIPMNPPVAVEQRFRILERQMNDVLARVNQAEEAPLIIVRVKDMLQTEYLRGRREAQRESIVYTNRITPPQRPQTLEGLRSLATETVTRAAPKLQPRTQPRMKYGANASSGMADNSSCKPSVPPRPTTSASTTIPPPTIAAKAKPEKSVKVLFLRRRSI